MKYLRVITIGISGLILIGWGFSTRGTSPTMPATRTPNYYLQVQAGTPQTNPDARQGTEQARGCPVQFQLTGTAPVGNNGAFQFAIGPNGAQIQFGFSFGG